MDLKFFEEQVSFTTLLVQAQSPEGKTSTASAFLLKANVPGLPGREMTFLVTCKHCLFGEGGLVSLRMHQRSELNPDLPDLTKPLEIPLSTYAGSYYEHDDPNVDVVAVNLTGLLFEKPSIFYMCIGLEHFIDPNHQHWMPGREVMFVGYPLGLSDPTHNLPITRSGRIASIPKLDFDGKPEFLIDAQVFKGSSGSPVFTTIDGTWKFVGIVGRNYWHAEEIEYVNAPAQAVVRQPIGLGIVYKPKAVIDILEKAFEAARQSWSRSTVPA